MEYSLSHFGITIHFNFDLMYSNKILISLIKICFIRYSIIEYIEKISISNKTHKSNHSRPFFNLFSCSFKNVKI